MNFRRFDKEIIFAVSVIIVGLFFVSVFYSLNQARDPVLVFNKGRAIKEFALELEKTKLSEAKKKKIIKSFSVAMQETLDGYALNNNAVIFTSNQILTGALDVTDKVLPLIAIKLKAMKSVGEGHA